MKIVFLIDRDLDKRYCERYGFDELLQQVIDLEIWDCAQLVQRPASIVSFHAQDIINKIQDISYIQTFIPQDSVYFVDVLSNPELEFVPKTIRNNGGLIIRHKGVIPLSAWTPNWFEKIKYVCLKIRTSKKKLFLLYKLIYRVLRLKFDVGISIDRTSRNVDIWMCAGSESKKRISLADESTKIIWTHHYDYDVFLKHGKNVSDKGYVVYLDNADFAHPDIKTLDYHPQLSINEFSKSIEKFLDYVEKQTKCPVVVAGHPRVKKEIIENTYKRKKVVQGKTAELVKGAKMVIAMDSTSINYAVLWNKPLVFITSKEAQRNSFFSMAAIEQIFKVKPINIDKDFYQTNLFEQAELPKKIYSDYIDRFIKKIGGLDKNRWIILTEQLQLMNKGSISEN